MNNSIKETKNELVSIGNRVNQIEERISNIKDRNLFSKNDAEER